MKTAILFLIINTMLWSGDQAILQADMARFVMTDTATLSGGYPDTKQDNLSQYVMTVTVTAYSPSVDETDSTPHTTASNRRVRDGICALSRDIEKEFDLKFGDMIYLYFKEGIEICEFQDRMNLRIRKTVDLFIWWKRAALRFGVIENVGMGFERRPK